MTKEIKLTKNQIALVDDDWYESLSKYTWHCTNDPTLTSKPVYAARRIRVEGKLGGRIVLMHHYILPRIDGFQTDHINGNGLDNRSENLRYCTQTQNNYNTKHKKNSKSKYKGVCPGKVTGTWRANIYIDGRQTMLGVFNTEEEAAAAWNDMAIKYHGEFAKLNDVSNIPYKKRERVFKGKPVGRSGIVGIHINFESKTNRWQVHKKDNGKHIYLKQFDTLEKAKEYANFISSSSSV